MPYDSDAPNSNGGVKPGLLQGSEFCVARFSVVIFWGFVRSEQTQVKELRTCPCTQLY